jgi:hypothetical protein
MAGSYRDRKLVVATNADFKRQLAFGNSMPQSDLNFRHPQTTPAFPGRTVTRDSVRDCTGEYLIKEEITSRLARLTVTFDADARTLAGWLAEGMGVSGSISGSQTAQVWTITPTGSISDGYWTIAMTFEGVYDISQPIAWNATAAQIKEAMEDMKVVKKGQVSVSGTLATTVVITGTGKWAAGAISNFDVEDADLIGGGTLAVVITTPGTTKLLTISRTNLSQTPVISAIVGFEGDTTDPRLYQDLAVNSVTINGALRGKVTVTVELVGSAKTIAAVGYVMPTCVNKDPVFTKDCRVKINGVFIASELRDFTYTFSNNVFVGDDPFPYDDIDVVRLEHGDRTSSFTLNFFGSPGDTNYDLAEDEENAEVQLLVGAPVNRTTVIAPKTNLRLSDTPITFAGEANRSSYTITGTPYFDGDITGTPDYVTYRGPESTTFLVAST